MPETNFGLNQLGKPTPNWAKMLLKITVVATSVAVFIVAGTTHISEAGKLEWALWLKGVDMFVLGISQMFGIDISRDLPPPINYTQPGQS